MNDDMKDVMEFITSRYKLTVKRAGHRNDGVEPKFLKARFKQQLKNSLCFAVARGNALAMVNQGVHGVCVSR